MRLLLALAIGLAVLGPVAAADKLILAHGPDEKLIAPFAVTFAADGTPYFCEMEKGHRLRKIVAGTVVTVAGTGEKGTPATATKGSRPSSTACTT